jgi:hypothetical protein
MQPDIWGKYIWLTIHLVSIGYPKIPNDSDKTDYKEFYENLYKILPCYTCAENYKKHLLILPLSDSVLESNKTLFNWTIDMHNIVNKMLGKPIITYSKAYEMYSIDINKQNENIKQSMVQLKNHIKIPIENHARRICIIMNILIILIGIWWVFKIKKA